MSAVAQTDTNGRCQAPPAAFLNWKRTLKYHAYLLIGIIAVLFGCASNPGKTSNSFSASSNELAAGETIHKKILDDFQPYSDPKLNAYLQDVVTKLASHAKRKKLNYRVTILNDERIYAISAPGGEIYITTAFLAFLKNEAELAAVLGHEVGELQFLNPEFNPIRKTLDGVTKVGSMVGPMLGQIGALASLGLVGLHAAYARDPNLETRVLSSDRWAMNTMLEEGYDPQALVDVLTHFAKYDRQLLSLFYDYYQSRPITINRVNSANAGFKKMNLEGKNLETFFDRYRKNTANVNTSAA